MNIKQVAETFLGYTVQDKVTGFTGVAVGAVQYLTGCAQVAVAPKVKEDGTVPDSHWYDWTRLNVLPVARIAVGGDTPTDNGADESILRAPGMRV